MNKFWNWIRDADTGSRVLRLEGPIDEESFWGDEITPRAFREELEAEEGDVTVWINSPGGNGLPVLLHQQLLWLLWQET